MNDKPAARNFVMNPNEQPPFADFMGMKITHVSPDRVTAELVGHARSSPTATACCTAAR